VQARAQMQADGPSADDDDDGDDDDDDEYEEEEEDQLASPKDVAMESPVSRHCFLITSLSFLTFL
jgi:hypothetical protein